MKVYHPESVADALVIGRKHFGLTVSEDQYSGWRAKNSGVILQVSYEKQVLGYMDFLPLTNSAADELIRGGMSETELYASHILDADREKECEIIYWAGFAVLEPGSPTGHRAAGYLLRSFRESLLNRFCAPTILVCVASPSGKKVIDRLGFVLRTRGEDRKDKMDLYEVEFTKETASSWEEVFDTYWRI